MEISGKRPLTRRPALGDAKPPAYAFDQCITWLRPDKELRDLGYVTSSALGDNHDDNARGVQEFGKPGYALPIER